MVNLEIHIQLTTNLLHQLQKIRGTILTERSNIHQIMHSNLIVLVRNLQIQKKQIKVAMSILILKLKTKVVMIQKKKKNLSKVAILTMTRQLRKSINIYSTRPSRRNLKTTNIITKLGKAHQFPPLESTLDLPKFKNSLLKKAESMMRILDKV